MSNSSLSKQWDGPLAIAPSCGSFALCPGLPAQSCSRGLLFYDKCVRLDDWPYRLEQTSRFIQFRMATLLSLPAMSGTTISKIGWPRSMDMGVL